ncbi:MAG: HEPN domain-containing protein [Deltaproteobacteria bacterium]|nr:HEPN domain-containing protein [Deltaproteobacteria bacterium]
MGFLSMERHNKELVLHRIERAKEHHQSAKELFANGHFLDSVSRSYYVVFSATRAVLATVDMDNSRHSGVISLFDKHFVKEGKIGVEASRIIHEAMECRVKADYADYPDITKDIAENELVKAERFMKEVEEYIKGLGREEMGEER